MTRSSCDFETVLRWQLEEYELVVGQSPAGKNVSTKAEDHVDIHRQATTSEDTAD
jgi:hypothetical protein